MSLAPLLGISFWERLWAGISIQTVIQSSGFVFVVVAAIGFLYAVIRLIGSTSEVFWQTLIAARPMIAGLPWTPCAFRSCLSWSSSLRQATQRRRRSMTAPGICWRVQRKSFAAP